MREASSETLRSELMTAARQLFGAERAEALAPELAALAEDLARVAGASLPGEGEPGFFLLAK